MLSFRTWGRLSQVVVVATRCGLGYLIDRLSTKHPLRFSRRQKAEPPAYIAAERIVDTLELLGPTYVKLGQFLSMRPDILPPVFITAFNRLYKDVSPVKFEDIKTVISDEFQQPLEKIYRNFSPVPRAAASLAQVHDAELDTGLPVVVKVQRPGLARLIRSDMKILEELAVLISRRIPEARLFGPEELVKEFRYQLNRELDFQLEGMRIERFQTYFKDDPDIYLPQVFWDYTTSRVLTMEKVEGILPDVEKLQQAGISPEETARRIFRIFLKEVLDFGMFHADPHPGNILIQGNKICLLDFGQVGIIPEVEREIIVEIIASLVQDDKDSLISAFYRFRLISPDINERLLRREITDFFEQYKGLPAGRIRLGQFIIDSIKICRRFNISFPSDMAMLGKSLLMVESLASTLNPDFEPVKESIPFVREMRKKRMAPNYISDRLIRKSRLAARALTELPGLLFSIVRKVESGSFKIHFLHEGLRGVTEELEGSINRLAIALIFSALIICLTIIILHFL